MAEIIAGISLLPAPDDHSYTLKAAQRTKLFSVTAPSRFRGRQLRSGGRATHEVPAFRQFTATAPDVCPFFARRTALRVPRQTAGTAQIRRSMSPNNRWVKCPSASRRQQEPVVSGVLHQPAPSFRQPLLEARERRALDRRQGPERSSWCCRIAAASRCDCHAVEPLRIRIYQRA